MKKKPNIKIIKANGDKEEYSREKFIRSLKRAGTDDKVIDKVQKRVEENIYEGMTTGELYDLAHKFLAEESVSSATKYSLKKSIMELGPAGYLFESYFSAVLEENRFKTRTNVELRGECVTHEVDVLADKENLRFIIEAKYHNSRGVKSDIQTALYTYARFLDIEKGSDKDSDHRPWLVTNTKFTSQAVKYGECKNIRMTGWDYPKNKNLQSFIEPKNLYPVTALPSVNKYARERLSETGIYFAKDLIDYSADDLNKKFGIYNDIARKIEVEGKDFINNK